MKRIRQQRDAIGLCPLLLLWVTAISSETLAWTLPQVSSRRVNPVSPLLLASSRNVKKTDPTSGTNGIFASSPTTTSSSGKKKTNKYAKFSQVEKSSDVDPFEALIRESEEKLRQLQQEKEATVRPKIKPVTPDADKRLTFPHIEDIDPYDPTTFGYVEIGTVLGPHGVHGWNKVQGCTDFPERLTTPGMVLHFKPLRKRAPRKVLLANGKCTGPDSFLVQLQDVYDREQAEKLKGGTLYYATQQDHVKKEDDLLLSDLVGLEVALLRSEDENEDHNVGTVGAIVLAEELCAIPGLGQNMLEVVLNKRSHGSQSVTPGTPRDLVLIPMVPEIVPKVDLKAGRVWIDPPTGLLDLTYIRQEKVRIKGLLPPAKE